MSYLTYKFRLYPTKEQEQFFLQTAGCCRWIWNEMLNRNIAQYKSSGKFVFYNQMNRELTDVKKQPGVEWLNDAIAQSLQFSISCLDKALRESLKSNKARKGFPKFKSKKDATTSFRVPQNFKIENRFIKIPKISKIKYKKHRKIEGIIKSLTITRDVGQWFVSILCEHIDAVRLANVSNPVGIDLGIKDFAVTSGGEVMDDAADYEKLNRRFVTAQRRLAKKAKGSNNREKARLTLARLYRKIRRKRRDFLHKTSSSITKSHDAICLENLNVSGMMKNHKLAKAIGQQGWFTFKQMLKYKMERKGGCVLEVGRFFPSSKTCSRCGWIQDTPLSERVYRCHNCGLEIDRDLNAALNIRDEAVKQIRQELPESKPVETPTPEATKLSSRCEPMKQEAKQFTTPGVHPGNGLSKRPACSNFAGVAQK